MEKWIRLGEYTCADPTRQKEFDDFYDNVHIPNILKAPGFVLRNLCMGEGNT